MKKLYPTLQKPTTESKELFNNLEDANDLATFFEIPKPQLIYILYHEKKPHYQAFTIPKKTGGTRNIHKPIGSIDILQSKLLPFLYNKYRVKKAAHGFIKEKSVLTNAQMHLKKKYILNIDLKDFFGSINFGRVYGLFMSEPFKIGQPAAAMLAQLCCYEDKLPQGAKTSPILSNFIASSLDKKLVDFAKANHCTYTRYADDITLSSTKKFSSKVLLFEKDVEPTSNEFVLSDVLKYVIESSGFSINYKKVRLQIKSVRQEVTGIIVNDFPNVKRTFIRQIRAMIYSWESDGLESAAKKHLEHKSKKNDISTIKDPKKYFINVVVGKLAYLKMIRGHNDIILSKYSLKVSTLMGADAPKFIKDIKMSSEEFDVFICHASEDKELVARPLYNALTEIGLNAFLDEEYISWGDSLTAKINNALGRSKYVITILSEHSIKKEWPLKEINTTLAREIGGEKLLLPIVVGDHAVIFKELPLLADKLYKEWNNNPKQLAKMIAELSQ